MGAFLYSCNIAQAYRQLLLDPADCPLVCLNVDGRFFADISLPFELRWAASHCQDVKGLVARKLGRQDLSLLNYDIDVGGVANMESEAGQHFNLLQAMLEHLGLEEA